MQLYNEFCTVHAIQNISLEATGALAPIPIPLKVSRLDTYKYKGDIENYREFMGYIFASSEFHQNNMLCIMVEKKM